MKKLKDYQHTIPDGPVEDIFFSSFDEELFYEDAIKYCPPVILEVVFNLCEDIRVLKEEIGAVINFHADPEENDE